MVTAALVGALDTKGTEYAFLRDVLVGQGCEVVMINAGAMADPDYPVDYTRRDVAEAAGVDIDVLVAGGDRAAAVAAMAEGAAVILERLARSGRVHGVLGAGGSGGTAIVSHAMRRLPIGLPKILVSTMASGDVHPYVDVSDIAMIHSVVDIAGINAVSREVLGNAAVGLAAMASRYAARERPRRPRPLVGATMYGTTTPCVDRARHHLDQAGFEVLVFHANGVGGRAMERLVAEGRIAGVLDVTTSELIDEVAGGMLSAGPERLEVAGAQGIPQVVSVGAADQITFCGPAPLPERFSGRTHYIHNVNITLVRSNAEECAVLGELMAAKLNRARGPVAVFLPLRGTSSYAVAGGVFHDPEADTALFTSLEQHLKAPVEIVAMDTDINDPAFALAMARRLEGLLEEQVGVAHDHERHEGGPDPPAGGGNDREADRETDERSVSAWPTPAKS